jgi:3-deoxy-manno-octulosonate cytidylyltransferase (CMP-KDO synthetase)
MKDIVVCIPVRYDSEQLPGKPLLEIKGKTIIQLVYENVSKINDISVIVLTDDQRIYDNVKSFNGNCEFIKDHCVNGTDRIIHYLQKHNLKNKIVVNVQGDEPFVNPNDIMKMIDNFHKTKETKTVCSTLYYETQDREEIKSKCRNKLVLDKDNNILYCSRNIIPGTKKDIIIPDYKYKIHIGLFAFDSSYHLNHYCKENTNLQMTEDIEWLKIVEQGFKINAIFSDKHEIGIDTIEDYNYLKDKYEK